MGIHLPGGSFCCAKNKKMKRHISFTTINADLNSKSVSIIFFLLNCYLFSLSQDINIYNNQFKIAHAKINFTVPVAESKKRFWRAASEWALAQAIPWSSNRYIRKAEFAKISIQSIRHNLKTNNWEWDDNKFLNNQISHPYQGSLYFNSFRSNGFNFWESVPAAFTGSLFWETVCETHVPAPNDIINTTLGGIAFGEISNRLSKLILTRKGDKKRAITRGTAAYILNPMEGINRLTSYKHAKIGVENDSIMQASLVADAGQRTVIKNGKNSFNKTEIFGRITLQFGDPFSDCKKPFNNFSVMAEVGNSDSALANTLQIEGILYGKKIKQTCNSQHIFNISMNYDYFQNSAFVFGAQSFRANLLSQFNLSKNIKLQLKVGAGVIVLAALPDKYLFYGEGRKYDYASGLNIHVATGINIANKVFYNFNFFCGKTKRMDNISKAYANLFYNYTSILRIVIHKNVTVNASSSNYFFDGFYKDYPNVYNHHFFRYVGLGYKISL